MKNIYCFILLLFSLAGHSQWIQSPIVFPPDPRDGAFTFVLNDTAYIGAGILINDLWKFNEADSTWTQKNNVANNLSRAFATAFEYNNFGYVVGGDSAFGNSMKDVWKYDPVADSWTQLNDFPGGNRVGMLCWKIGSRIFVAAGTSSFGGAGYGTIYKDMYEYLPATDTWNQLGDLPFTVSFASCFVIGNKGYFVNGNKSNSAYNGNVYEFDPQTGNWTMKALFPGSQRNAGIAFSYQGNGYSGLGQSSFSTNYKDFYKYDPVADTWSQLTNYPSIVSAWSGAFVLGNKAYVGTGIQPSTFDFSDKLYRYEFLSNPNTSIPVKSGGDGKIYVYPNPCYDHLTVGVTPVENQHRPAVTICDVTGSVVKLISPEDLLAKNVLTISMIDLPPGVYFVKTSYTDASSSCQKLIKGVQD